MDYENMLKAELIADLEENDVELNSIDVVDKTKKVWNPMLFRYEYK